MENEHSQIRFRRPSKGSATPSILTAGFRPFFLAAGLYAALPMIAWLAWIAIHAAGGAVTGMSIAMAPHIWHAHEMVFGFGGAAIAGFLLTAVPNWTGARRLQGLPLAALVALWGAGRVVMWVSAWIPALLVALIDLAFLPVLGALLARQLAVSPAPRNIMLVSLVGILAAANFAFHLDQIGLVDGVSATVARVGLLTLALLVTIIGGRVVPGFTRKALKRRGITDAAMLPQNIGPLNMVSIVSVVLYLAVSAASAPPVLLGAIALVAAVANGVRLWLWQTKRTLGEPIVWALHLAYGWLVVGFALAALAGLTSLIGSLPATHALGTGAVGTMILAIMSRAALGHTGRPLVTPRPVVASYGLVSLAAFLRAFGPDLVPGLHNETLLAAGGLWTLAFVIFTVVYFPILTGPRTVTSPHPRQRTHPA